MGCVVSLIFHSHCNFAEHGVGGFRSNRLLVLEHQIGMIDQLNQLNFTLPYCNGDPVNILLPGNPTKQHIKNHAIFSYLVGFIQTS